MPLPPASATWRQVRSAGCLYNAFDSTLLMTRICAHPQVYTFHHRSRLSPRGPFVPTPQSTIVGNRLLLAHASSNGMAAWLFLGPLPPKPTPPLLLPFRLLLQNVAHDVACLPYQRLRLVITPSADVTGVDGALTRARTISNVSVGTSHAAASSSGSSSSSDSDDDFFLDEDDEEGKGKQQQRKKHGVEAGPCVVACNERRLEGKERIPWRRFKVYWKSLRRKDFFASLMCHETRACNIGHGGRTAAPRPLRHGRALPAPALPRRLPHRHAPGHCTPRHVRASPHVLCVCVLCNYSGKMCC